MPDATITSTASTFGTISGTFAADQSTVTGTVTAIIPGTLSGSVGVPGPQGPAGPAGVGVPVGGTAGQVLAKVDGVDYNTEWVNVQGDYLPLTGGAMSYGAEISFNSEFSISEINGDHVQFQRASNSAEFSEVKYNAITVVDDAGNVTIYPGGIIFPDSSAQTTAFLPGNYYTSSVINSIFAPKASPVFTGNPTAPTAALGDNDTSIATTAFVQQEILSGTANAKNLEVYVRNQTGSTLAAGTIVYVNGATGNRPTVTPAQANNDATSAQTIGFVKTSIANNGFGYVIVRGELENINTSALTEGVQLYLSPTTAGTWTTTKPSAPQHLVYVGIVIRSHPTLGVILVSVQNGYELNELHDVALASEANNDLLVYESSTDLWKNKSFSTLGLATQSYVTSQGYITSSALTGYATESWVTSQGYLTSAPVTSVAGRTGAVVLSNTDISGLGTMATATASDYSTTTVANGLYYPLSSNPAGYLTSAPVTSVAGKTGAVTLAVADVSGAAPTDSPTFTGTPSLPTGTTAVTQSAGNNTTAVATTAFVTAAVPAVATTAQALDLTSNSVTVSPLALSKALMHPSFRKYTSFAGNAVGTTSGTGSSNYAHSHWIENIGPSSGTTGGAMMTPANVTGYDMIGRDGENNINFSKKILFSGKFGLAASSGYNGDANNYWLCTLGKTSAYLGNLTGRGIGIRKFGATANFFLVVHNGTTLTAVDSGVNNNSYSANTDFLIYSDGAGNVTMWLNDVQVATTAAGPTGTATNGARIYSEVNQSGTFGARLATHTASFGLFISP